MKENGIDIFTVDERKKMKFYDALDEKVFKQELESCSLSEAEFIKKRKILIKGIKDRKKAEKSKSDWRSNRFKHMRGIKRFHKSTKGKRFHRDLGRFLATRELKGLAYGECQELVVPITSCLTHSYFEFGWFMNIQDSVDYEIFAEEVYNEVLEMLAKLKTIEPDMSDYEEFLYRVVETNSLIQGFADRFSKSKEEVEAIWDKVKSDLLKQGRKETDEDFYKILVGTLKKILIDSSKRPRVQKG